ncbi:MAG TPA: TonB family protein [Acidobacteriota bacterium]|nr:TonB family protein [Acidobacteriota bacterium]
MSLKNVLLSGAKELFGFLYTGRNEWSRLMNMNKTDSMESDRPDNYEATVLDFLEREMEAAKPGAADSDHSEDLDALVTGLLKQVITETDPSKARAPETSSEIENVLAEFPPVEEKELYSRENPPEPSATPPETIAAEKRPASSLPMARLSPAVQEKTESAAGDMRPANAKKSDLSAESSGKFVFDGGAATPVEKTAVLSQLTAGVRRPIMAIAAACLMAVIGGAVYFFIGTSPGSSGATESQSHSGPFVASTSLSDDPGVPPPAEAEVVATLPPEPAIPKPAQQTAKSSPPPIEKIEIAPPLTVAGISLPAPPENDRPALSWETISVPSASPEQALNTFVPAAAPARPAPPAAPRRASSAEAKTGPAKTAVYAVSGALVPAVLVSQVSPRYPELAIRSRQSASVVLDLVIDETGAVIEATPVSGPTLFHKEAIDAAMQWRYRPASIGGANVRSQSRITLNFSMR